MEIKGIIFDFDGLICDTESTELHAWERLYADYGIPFPFDEYQKTIGAVHNDETPLWLLKYAGGDKVDLEEARKTLHEYHRELNEVEPMRPGVFDYLRSAQELELRIGLASSSPFSWVNFHLERLEIKKYFECIKTFEDVHRTKPDPQLFTLTLECLNMRASQVIALEDSIHGVAAAKAAGLITVAVPNEVTRRFTFYNADLVLPSLDCMTLQELIEKFS
jgi:putative hydrolase of the HAD superfamily